MKLYVKNKIISVGGSSEVTDENGKEVFRIKGRAFSPTKVKTIFDLNGNKLYKVRNKFWRINFFRGPKILIYDSQDNKIASFRNTKIFRPNFVLEGQNGQFNLKPKGFMKGYEVFENGELIGELRGKVQGLEDIFRDSFEIETIKESSDPAFLVTIVIALDNYRDKLTD